jgi:hypothetical protein
MLERQRQRESQAPGTQPTSAPSPDLHEAWGRLLAHRYYDAYPPFEQVLESNVNETIALEGRAICEYELNSLEAAQRDAQRLRVMTARMPSRARQVVVLSAVVAIARHQALDMLRPVREQMQSLETQGKLDEELQNILGKALWELPRDNRYRAYVQETGRYYLAYDQKLAEQKSGLRHRPADDRNYATFDPFAIPTAKRWGSTWLSPDVAEEKWKRYAGAVALIDTEVAVVTQADAQIVQAKQEYRDWEERHGGEVKVEVALKGKTDDWWPLELFKLKQNWKIALEHASHARSELANTIAREKSVETPPFPAKVEPVWYEPG